MLTPLLDALRAHQARGTVSFHTPGHKGTLDPFDLTELEGLGELHGPTGPIREAQERAAVAFGADRTFFLVNGSTVGNQAMVLAACPPGKKILISRASHQSVLAGLILSGGIPVFLEPVWEQALGIPLGVLPESVEHALEEHPDAVAVHLTSPTYWGVVSDLPRIASRVHSRGLPLLVDEAHGPHFHFHPGLPPSALEAGADLAVQSTHKLLPARTQSAMLHQKGARIDPARIQDLLRLLQSSSPSYPLMASLDGARARMEEEGEGALDRMIRDVAAARDRIGAIPGLRAWHPAGFGFDPTKLVIDTGGLMRGDAALDFLEARGLILELAAPAGILALLTIDNSSTELERLIFALAEMKERPRPVPPYAAPPPFDLVMSPREAFYAPAEEVPLPAAVGRVSAEAVIPHPPGIPLLFPGARITLAIVRYLKNLDASKGSIRVLTRSLL